MPTVTMPDGTNVEMPDKLDPQTGSRLRSFMQSQQSKPPGEATPPAEPSKGSAINFTAQNLDAGLAALAGMPVDTVENVLDLANAAAAFAQDPKGFLNISAPNRDVAYKPELRSREKDVGSSAWIENVMRRMGIITPQADPTTPAGRVAASALRAAPSALLSGKADPKALVKDLLKASASGGAAQTAAEAGIGPAGQILAGMLPDAASQLPGRLAESARRSLTGSTNVSENVKRAQEAGVERPTAGMATGSHALQTLESGLSLMPGGAPVMQAAGEKRAAGMGQRVRDLIGKMAPGSDNSAETVGRAVKAGLTSRVEQTREVESRLHTRVEQLAPPGTEVDVSNIRNTLRERGAPIKGAEALSGRLTSPLVRGLLEDLEADLAAVAPKAAPETEGGGVFFGQGTTRPGGAAAPQGGTGAIRKTTTNRRGAELEQIDRTVPVKDIAPEGRAAKNTLPLDAVMRLRRKVGQKLDGLSILADEDRGTLKALYRSLSDDVRSALPKGSEARTAWDRANKYSTALHNQADKVWRPLLSKNTYEQATTALLSGTEKGASNLRQVMNGLKSEEQRGEVRAYAIENLGKAPPSQQSTAQDVFSPVQFATRYNKLHADAKKALFPSAQMRADLEQIAQVATDMQKAGRGAFNPSGTARSNMHAGAVSGTITGALFSLATGHPGVAAATAASAGGAYVASRALARAMSSPDFVHWLATASKSEPVNTQAYLARLTTIANHTQDPQTAQAISDIQDQIQEAIGGAQPQ